MKNECFEETGHENLTQEMKDRFLPLLILMVMKREGDIKSIEVANGSFQRLHAEKSYCSSSTPDLYSFKHACAMIAI